MKKGPQQYAPEIYLCRTESRGLCNAQHFVLENNARVILALVVSVDVYSTSYRKPDDQFQKFLGTTGTPPRVLRQFEIRITYVWHYPTQVAQQVTASLVRCLSPTTTLRQNFKKGPQWPGALLHQQGSTKPLICTKTSNLTEKCANPLIRTQPVAPEDFFNTPGSFATIVAGETPRCSGRRTDLGSCRRPCRCPPCPPAPRFPCGTTFAEPAATTRIHLRARSLARITRNRTCRLRSNHNPR